jgi:uncharacterized protein YukE
MADEIGLDDAAYRHAHDQVAAVHDELRSRGDSLSETMRSLLGGGWTGVAAEEFAQGWSDWEAGCDQVLDGLAGMHDAMASAFAELHSSDDQQGATMGLLHQRLGGLS